MELAYPPAERWLTGILLGVFLIFVAAITIVGAISGLTALPASVSQAAPVVTAAWQPWVNSILNNAQELIVSLGSAVIGPNLVALNAVRDFS